MFQHSNEYAILALKLDKILAIVDRLEQKESSEPAAKRAKKAYKNVYDGEHVSAATALLQAVDPRAQATLAVNVDDLASSEKTAFLHVNFGRAAYQGNIRVSVSGAQLLADKTSNKLRFSISDELLAKLQEIVKQWLLSCSE